MRKLASLVLATAIVVALGVAIANPIEHQSCVGSDSSAADDITPFQGLEARLVTDGLDEPSDVMHLPGTNTYLVSEKPGRVVAVKGGVIGTEPVLDIEEMVLDRGNEQGLLTLEPHPDFDQNCLVYIFYTDAGGHSNLVEAEVSGYESPRIDRRTFRRILYVPQAHQYHQSGSVTFDDSGNLIVSIGDGGSRTERERHAQDPQTVKATIVRINTNGNPYSIPEDNPFIDSNQGAPEVWGFGLRNPWRITYDQESGRLIIPDVGHSGSEEINLVDLSDSGQNFGWPIVEGTLCFESETCDTSGTRLPDYEYLHEGYGCAVIGGSVYRGDKMPDLDGHYFFGDYCLGWVRSLSFDGSSEPEVYDWEPDMGRLGRITSFGTDSSGELLVTSLDGQLWEIVPIREN